MATATTRVLSDGFDEERDQLAGRGRVLPGAVDVLAREPGSSCGSVFGARRSPQRPVSCEATGAHPEVRDESTDRPIGTGAAACDAYRVPGTSYRAWSKATLCEGRIAQR